MSTATYPLDTRLAAELPAEVAAEIAEWQAARRLEIILDRWLTTGHTPAPVATAGIHGPELDALKVILKLCPPDPYLAREPKRHLEALERSPAAFATSHLVRQPLAPVQLSESKWWLLFQEVAGGSLVDVRPLSAFWDNEALPRVVANLVSGLLADWNPKKQLVQTDVPEFFRRVLETRLDSRGPITLWAAREGVGTDPWIRVGGTVVPNAFVWATDQNLESPNILAVLGNGHGDLHLDNVMVPALEPDSGFRLIDLSAYSPRMPLAVDPIHLLLSSVVLTLNQWSEAQRRELLLLMSDLPYEPEATSLALQGYRTLALSVVEAGNGAVREAGFKDDWADQTALAIAATALRMAARGPMSDLNSAWAYELACRALGTYLERKGIAPSETSNLAVVGEARRADAGAELVAQAADYFAGSRVALAVASQSLSQEAKDLLALAPWTAVIDFDPGTDTTGALRFAKKSGLPHRLTTAEQQPRFGRGTTTWFAAEGLDPENLAPSFMEWRRQYRSSLERFFAVLAQQTSAPVTVVTLGDVNDRVRVVVEQALDVLDQRVTLLAVTTNAADVLDPYQPVIVAAEPEAVLAGLPRATRPISSAIPAIPGQHGAVELSPIELLWFAEIGDLLHSHAGLVADPERVADAFYRGKLISWFELDLDVDLPRDLLAAMLKQARADLDARDSYRHAFYHYPGAGGTTLARRLAWDLRNEVPVMYIRGARDAQAVAERLRELARLTALPVFAVFELTADELVDRVYSELRSDSVACVLVVLGRRMYAPPKAGERSFYLSYLETRQDCSDFARQFAQLVDGRENDLYNIVGSDQIKAVPFLFALTAFEEQFVGVPPYVEQLLVGASDAERAVLVMIALAHRYAGSAVSADVFSQILDVSPDAAVNLSDRLQPSALAALVREGDETWRTLHWLVAEEILRQTLKPSADSGPDDWQTALSHWAQRLIEEASELYGDYLPSELKNVLDRLFIIRDDQDPLTHERADYAELLQAIPTANGRLETLRKLSEAFPLDAHYRAHLGRFLSYTFGAYGEALDCANAALDLDDNDDTLYHMRGMVHRRQVRELIHQHPRAVDRGALEADVLGTAELAMGDFRRSQELADQNEYGYISAIQLAVDVIEFGRAASGESTFARFFARPDAAIYRDFLAEAEDALDRVREIRAGDAPSAYEAAVAVELRRVYDDFAGLLQGWRNLLTRQDVVKAPIRRRIARAYEIRSGNWRSASTHDRRQAIELLNQNLRDNPRDTRSLLDWLKVARLEGASLDRAAELISYSADATRDTLFYAYAVTVLMAVSGREAAVQEYRLKVQRSRDRAASFPRRRYNYEWLGFGEGLGALVHHTDLRDWDRRAGGPDPPLLQRVEGRVLEIRGPQAGQVLVGGRLHAFFTPSAGGFIADRDENVRISMLLGFSYEGLQAWSVKKLGSE